MGRKGYFNKKLISSESRAGSTASSYFAFRNTGSNDEHSEKCDSKADKKLRREMQRRGRQARDGIWETAAELFRGIIGSLLCRIDSIEYHYRKNDINNMDFRRKFFSTILLFVAALFLIHNNLPIAGYYTPAVVYLLLTVIIFVLLEFSSVHNIVYYAAFIIPFIAVEVMRLFELLLHSQADIPIYLYGIVQTLVLPMCVLYLLNTNNRKAMKAFLIMIGVMFIITMITTCIGVLNHPLAARVLATSISTTDPYYVELMKENVGGFTTVYQAVLMFPLLICLFKNRILKLLPMLLLTVLVVYMVIKTEYTMALLFLAFSFILFLFPQKKLNSKNIILLMIFVVVGVFVMRPVIADICRSLSKVIDSYAVSQRFIYMADELNGVETETITGDRLMKYEISMKAFARDPLFGNFMKIKGGYAGGHSYFLDNMAAFGIIGIGCMGMFFRQIYVKFYKPFREQKYYGYMIYVFITAILFSVFNTLYFSFVTAVIVPMFAYVMQDGTYTEKCAKGLLEKLEKKEAEKSRIKSIN